MPKANRSRSERPIILAQAGGAGEWTQGSLGGVARVERSETRVGGALSRRHPGFALLNPGYARYASYASSRITGWWSDAFVSRSECTACTRGTSSALTKKKSQCSSGSPGTHFSWTLNVAG
jgi:hypothetical protein